MNCLACCSQDMLFQYMLSGWEGSMDDAALFIDARLHDLAIPPGNYYLADAGFGSYDVTLVHIRSVRYHLAEWGRSGVWYALASSLSLSAQAIINLSQAYEFSRAFQSLSCICPKRG